MGGDFYLFIFLLFIVTLTLFSTAALKMKWWITICISIICLPGMSLYFEQLANTVLARIEPTIIDIILPIYSLLYIVTSYIVAKSIVKQYNKVSLLLTVSLTGFFIVFFPKIIVTQIEILLTLLIDASIASVTSTSISLLILWSIVAYPSVRKRLTELRGREPNYQKYIEKAKKAFDNKKYGRALRFYKKIITILQKRLPLNVAQRETLGKAYLGMGTIFQAKKDTISAVDWYNKALNLILVRALPDTAVILLGHNFCQNKDKSDRAVEVFLRFIKLKSLGGTTKKVYSFLESMCHIDEAQTLGIRKKAVALNERVLSANPKIEWAHYYFGVGSFLNNKAANAKIHLSNAIKLNSERALSYYWLGKSYLDTNQIDNAVNYFLKFIKLIPPDKEIFKQAEAYFYIGESFIRHLGGFSENIDPSIVENSKKLERAITYFKQAILKDSNNANYYFCLAQTLSLTRNHDKAIGAYQKAIVIDTKNSDYLFFLANELKKIGNFEEAKEKIIRALALKERNEYYKLLADLYLITNNYEEAENQCLKVFGLKKGWDFETFCILVPALYHQAKYSGVVNIFKTSPIEIKVTKESQNSVLCIARSYSHLGSFGKAVGWYEKLIEKEERLEVLYYCGCALANKGDYERALAQFDKIIGQGSDYNDRAILQRGHIFLKTGKLKEAEKDYKKAYEIAPGNTDILSALGCLYYNSGDLKEAFSWFTRTLEIDSSHSLSRFGIGIIKEKQGEITEAVKEYELVLKNRGVSLPVHIRLGIFYYRQSNYQKALEYLEQVRKSGNESAPLLFYMGMALLFCKQINKALEMWNKLHSYYPDDTRLELNIYRAHYLLGCQYTKEGKYQEAISEWGEYLKKYDVDEITKRDLGELYFRAGVAELINGRSEDINGVKDLFDKAMELDSNNQIYLYYNGLCNHRIRNHTECIAQLNRLLEVKPDDPRVKYHIGLSLLAKGEKEKAINVFNELAKREDKDAYANHAVWIIANEYIKEGHYNEAISILEALI